MKKEEQKEAKTVVKRKFKFVKFIVALLLLYLFCSIIYEIFDFKITNIYISNNNYLTDQEVIDLSGLRNYPSFLLTNKNDIKRKLLKNKLISDVKITKKFFGQVYIDVNENEPLFYYRPTNKVVLKNGKEIENNNYIIPVLVNNIHDDIKNKLVEKYGELNNEIKLMISEIKYDPNEIDKERFIITMNDGNYVYITLYKTSLLNDYLKILSTLDANKGILYLDSGNYFEIIQ